MKAGRKLDALVAEKVLGGIVTTCVGGLDYATTNPNLNTDELTFFYAIPQYSTDMSAAWEVVEKLKEDFHVDLSSCGAGGEAWRCDITTDEDNELLHYWSTSKSAACAICLAALKVAKQREDVK